MSHLNPTLKGTQWNSDIQITNSALLCEEHQDMAGCVHTNIRTEYYCKM